MHFSPLARSATFFLFYLLVSLLSSCAFLLPVILLLLHSPFFPSCILFSPLALLAPFNFPLNLSFSPWFFCLSFSPVILQSLPSLLSLMQLYFLPKKGTICPFFISCLNLLKFFFLKKHNLFSILRMLFSPSCILSLPWNYLHLFSPFVPPVILHFPLDICPSCIFLPKHYLHLLFFSVTL